MVTQNNQQERKKSEIAELQNITYISTTTKHDMHTAICCDTLLLHVPS